MPPSRAAMIDGTMTDTPIGIAIIGTTAADARSARYRALPDRARLVATGDTDADIPAALARADVRAVDIHLPAAQQTPVALAALRAGKHVLLAQPFATATGEARALIHAAADARRFLMVADAGRFDPVVQRMAELLQDGEIGMPALCRLSRDPSPNAPHRAGDPWAATLRDIETVRMLTGDMPLQEVYAVPIRALNPNDESAALSVAALRFAYGVVGILSALSSGDGPARAEIIGDGGSLHHDGRGALTIVTPDGTRVETFPPTNTDAAIIDHFLACIAASDEPATAAWAMRDGLHALLALQASLALAAPVAPEPLAAL